jgi:hypothetical protein
MGTAVRWTEEEYAAARRAEHVAGGATVRPHKYHAEPTEADGHLFPSKREAERYLELRQMERVGLITDLRLQVWFPLRVGDIVIGRYVADFVYTDTESGGPVVEECKGFPTPLWKWKRRHAEAQLGLRIRVS